MPVSTFQAPISDTPFINPSPDPGATGPVRPPGQELEVSPAVKKHKGKSKQKKAVKPAASAGSSDQIALDPIPPLKTVVLLHLLQTVLLSRIRLCQTRNPFRTSQIKTPVRRVNFQILRWLKETKK